MDTIPNIVYLEDLYVPPASESIPQISVEKETTQDLERNTGVKDDFEHLYCPHCFQRYNKNSRKPSPKYSGQKRPPCKECATKHRKELNDAKLQHEIIENDEKVSHQSLIANGTPKKRGRKGKAFEKCSPETQRKKLQIVKKDMEVMSELMEQTAKENGINCEFGITCIGKDGKVLVDQGKAIPRNRKVDKNTWCVEFLFFYKRINFGIIKRLN